MGAGSKFDQPLTLIQDGHKVIACGPLNFQGCDVRAEVTIELVQPNHGRAIKTKVFPNKNFDKHRCEEAVGDDEDEWMMTATVEPPFMHSGLRSVGWGAAAFVTAPTPGPLVVAHGVITYYRWDGSQHSVPWTGDVNGNDLEARWQ
jgi:hypothetical protein